MLPSGCSTLASESTVLGTADGTPQPGKWAPFLFSLVA